MFRHFAYQGHGGDWGDEPPPWARRGWRGPRHFGMRIRRGLFGPGGPFGPEGPFGPGGEGRRFFGRGDVKYALLELLLERPMHGYEMMKALEQKSGGFYTPSAGSIYPTLQMLEDRGLVTVKEVDGKKIYSITDAGRASLAERTKEEEQFMPPWARQFEHGARRWGAPEMQALRSEAGEVARLFAIAGRMSFDNPEHLTRLRGIIERTRKDLSDLIYGAAGAKQGQAPTSTPDVEQA
ncbi:MAG TPA: PadR family transcriptional regulator [Ktedonosporobacter sp.]|nr:PadR family transcriptional regulator [Ktedonosporobacter sp.]